MLFSKVYNLSKSLADLNIHSFYSNSKDMNEEDKKIHRLKNYITLLYNLNEEMVKINYNHIFEDDEEIDIDEGAFFDMDYCLKQIILNNEDSHIPEIGLFKIVAEMIFAQLNMITCISKNSPEYQKIEEVYKIFKDYKYNKATDISLDSLEINDINVLQTKVNDYKFYNIYTDFYDKYSKNGYEIPDKVYRCFNTLQAIFHIDIIDGNYGYNLMEKLNQPFLEFNLFRSMVKIILNHSVNLKNEFDNLNDYKKIKKDCNKIIQMC